MTTIFPLATVSEGTVRNADPANENIVRMMALLAPALDFSDSEPSTPADGDQYVIRTTWGGFSVGNFVRWTSGAWREFTVWDGLSKQVAGLRYVRVSDEWRLLAEWIDVPGTDTSTGKSGQIAYDPTSLYFYVCTADNTWKRALMTSTIVPPPPPPTPDPATVLLHFDNSIVNDSSVNAYDIGVHLAVTQSTTAKFGAKALDFNGGYLTLDEPEFATESQDYTLEMWVYVTDLTGLQFFADNRNAGGSCFYHTDGVLAYSDSNNGNTVVSTGATLTANTWHHVELDQHGGTAYIFLDGILGGTLATTALINTRWIIGAAQYTPVGVNPLRGKGDEFRFLVGTAMHTANFTPRSTPYVTY